MKKKINVLIAIVLIALIDISFLSTYGEQNGGKKKKCKGVGKYMPDPSGTINVFVCPAPESTDSCNYPCVSNNNNS